MENPRVQKKPSLSIWVLAALSGMALLLLGSGAQAEDYRLPTQEEALVLPPYCKDSQIFSKPSRYPPDPATAHWFAVLGEVFWDIHHYCFGLIDINRAERALDARNRAGRYRDAISEFDYVLNSKNSNLVLLPEIHTNKGKALDALGQKGEAVTEFKAAIALKADYWVPHAYLSDLYKSNGDIGAAREALVQGIAANPTNKALARRLKALDEKPPKVAKP